MSKRNLVKGHTTIGIERAGSEPVDPTALSKALKGMEDAARVREQTPGASPSRKRQRVYGDRLVHSFGILASDMARVVLGLLCYVESASLRLNLALLNPF